jgi:hypothetical protein
LISQVEISGACIALEEQTIKKSTQEGKEAPDPDNCEARTLTVSLSSGRVFDTVQWQVAHSHMASIPDVSTLTSISRPI